MGRNGSRLVSRGCRGTSYPHHPRVVWGKSSATCFVPTSFRLRRGAQEQNMTLRTAFIPPQEPAKGHRTGCVHINTGVSNNSPDIEAATPLRNGLNGPMNRRLHSVYASLPLLGELHIETESCVRGRRWLDWQREGFDNELFIGSVHCVWSASPKGLLTIAFSMGWLLDPPLVMFGLF